MSRHPIRCMCSRCYARRLRRKRENMERRREQKTADAIADWLSHIEDDTRHSERTGTVWIDAIVKEIRDGKWRKERP